MKPSDADNPLHDPTLDALDAVEEQLLDEAETQEISSAEVKERAVKGASQVMARGMAIRGLGLVGNIFLARLLTPSDFGLAALGVTIITFSAAFTDGGLSTLFVRRKEQPNRKDLQAAVAVQSYATWAVVAACVIAALVIESKAAWVVATMVAPMAMVAVRVPAFVNFERTLNFAPAIRVEIAENLASVVFSVGAALAGCGVWSFVIGQWARVTIGTVMMVRLSPWGLVLPRWNTKIVKALLPYGMQFQGITVASLGLAQGLNVATAAAGGVIALGAWSLVFRLLQIPVLVFQGLRRVSYPGVARLLANGDDLAPVLLRVSKLSCVLGAVMVAGVAGGSDPGVVVLFGDKWDMLTPILPWCVAVTFINGPVSVAAFSYATVAGRLTTALWSSVAQAIIAPLLVLALYPSLGLTALIIGTGAAALIDLCVLGYVMWDALKINVFPTVLSFGAVTGAAGFAGHEIAIQIGPDLLAAAAGAIVAEIVLVVLLLIVHPHVTKDVLRLTRRAMTRRGGAGAPVTA